MRGWRIGGNRILGRHQPALMGILNATPDSFSDGDPRATPPALLARAHRLAQDGADLLDIGGESTRPGARPIGLREELERLLPILELTLDQLQIPLAVDTQKWQVAQRAIALGVSVINDIGGLSDPEMLKVVADADVGVVIMHMQGNPATMQAAPTYTNVVDEVRGWLAQRIDAAAALGISCERIAIDPGIGFGKTFDHNIALLRNLAALQSLGCPVLVGTSRKGFLGTITGRAIPDRGTASVVSALAAATLGAQILRVHEVASTLDAIKVWAAQVGWQESSTQSPDDLKPVERRP